MTQVPDKSSGLPPGYISIKKALALASERGITTTTATMITWVEKHKLGFQPGGLNAKWYIDEIAFGRFLDGQAIHPK